MRKFNLHPLTAAFIGLASSSLYAAETEATHQLSTIVVTASGFEQKITDAPASISVITKEELEKKPYMTLLDAVRDLEGVDIGETRDKTGQGTISMRGMGADYTLILVDGKRQNNHGDIYPNNFGGNQFNHIPPLDAIERIEVIRGPASTLYGADAMGGVINIITKKVTDKWQGSLSHSRTYQTDDNFGDDITTDFNVMGPLIANQLGLTLRGSFYNRMASNPTYTPVTYPNGETRIRALGFGSGGKTVDNENLSLGAKLSWTPTENQSISFEMDTSKQEYDNAPRLNDSGTQEYPVGTVDNIGSVWSAANFCKGATGNNQNACTGNGGTWERRANPQVGYAADQKFTRDTWSLTHEGDWNIGKSFVSLAYVETNNDGRTLPFTVAERTQLLAMIDGTGAYAGMSETDRKKLAESTFLPRNKRVMESNQYTLDAKLDMPFDFYGSHNTIVGTQIVRGELKDGVFGMEKGTPGEVQEHNMWSLFAEDTYRLIDPLAITAGLRYDNHEIFGSQVSPRLYGVYTLNDQLTFKGGISTGYKTPKTSDLYDGIKGFGGQGTSPMFGNPDLKAETSQSSELAVYWQHPAGHNLNATIFHNKFDDKIADQPCGTNTNLACAPSTEYRDLGYDSDFSANPTRITNIDEVVIQGLELAGRYEILDNLSFRANYTYTDSEQKSGANKGRPLGNTAKHMANATIDWAATNNFSLFLTTEARSDRYRSWDAVNNKPLYFKNYEVFHLGASYKASDTVTFNGRVNNLFDRDFTTYDLSFTECTSGSTCVGGFQPSYLDHYNNKDKARNYWLSVNVKF